MVDSLLIDMRTFVCANNYGKNYNYTQSLLCNISVNTNTGQSFPINFLINCPDSNYNISASSNNECLLYYSDKTKYGFTLNAYPPIEDAIIDVTIDFTS